MGVTPAAPPSFFERAGRTDLAHRSVVGRSRRATLRRIAVPFQPREPCARPSPRSALFTADPIAIAVETMRITVGVIDGDVACTEDGANTPAIQVGRRWRDAVIGICRDTIRA
jgi:hypothetical protein